MAGRVNKNTRRLTFCAVCVALGFVILMLGAFVEVLDLSAAAFAGMLSVVVVIELGGKWAWPTFFATGLLALLLLPARLPALFYLLFAGWYPIAKERIERLRLRPLRWVIKMLSLNAATIIAFLTAKYVLMIPDAVADWTWLLLLMLNGAFILFDIALTRLISLYIYRLRGRLRINRFFD